MKVSQLLGAPDDVQNNVLVDGIPVFDDKLSTEGWLYGSSVHDGFPTLGRVYFDRSGRVQALFGGGVPSATVLSCGEKVIRAQLQDLYSSPGLFANTYSCLNLERQANKLIALGKEKTLGLMEEFIRVSPHHRYWAGDGILRRRKTLLDEHYENLFLLLRAAFDLPGRVYPNIGSIDYMPSEWQRLKSMYPRFPLAMIKGTPYLLPAVLITGSDPKDSSIETHLEWFRKWGKMRRPYNLATSRMPLAEAEEIVSHVYPSLPGESFADIAKSLVAEGGS